MDRQRGAVCLGGSGRRTPPVDVGRPGRCGCRSRRWTCRRVGVGQEPGRSRSRGPSGRWRAKEKEESAPGVTGTVTLHWTAHALSDLGRLHDFLVTRNRRAAARAVQAIVHEPPRLLQNPRIGERLNEFDPGEVRRVLVRNYEIRYEIQGSRIYVLSAGMCERSDKGFVVNNPNACKRGMHIRAVVHGSQPSAG